jgi:hypothetical protein
LKHPENISRQKTFCRPLASGVAKDTTVMNKLWTLLLTLLLAGLCAAQTPSPSPNPASGPDDSATTHTRALFAPGTVLRLELDRSVDAKKAKVGDPVIAKMMEELLAGDQVVAPRGAKVLGHVAEVAAHQGDTPSTLGIAFDKILVNNQEVPLSGTIQAIGNPEVNTFGQNPSMGGMGPGGMNQGNNLPSPSGPMGGRTTPGMGIPSGAPQNPGVPGNPSSSPEPQTVNGQLTTSSQGVIGMSGTSLAAGSAGDSVLTSPKHNVKLDSGTQIILRTK